MNSKELLQVLVTSSKNRRNLSIDQKTVCESEVIYVFNDPEKVNKILDGFQEWCDENGMTWHRSSTDARLVEYALSYKEPSME